MLCRMMGRESAPRSATGGKCSKNLLVYEDDLNALHEMARRRSTKWRSRSYQRGHASPCIHVGNEDVVEAVNRQDAVTPHDRRCTITLLQRALGNCCLRLERRRIPLMKLLEGARALFCLLECQPTNQMDPLCRDCGRRRCHSGVAVDVLHGGVELSSARIRAGRPAKIGNAVARGDDRKPMQV